jgi:hypothetical protein
MSQPAARFAATSTAVVAGDAGEAGGHGDLILLAPLLVVLLCAVIVAVTWLGRRGTIGPLDASVAAGVVVGPIVAALSLGAGVIHAAVTPDHFVEFWLYGVFFVSIAVFQLLWGLGYLRRPDTRLVVLGIAVNAAAVLLWLWSRVVGLPVGPKPGTIEHVGFIDLMATIFEATLVAILVARHTSARAAAFERRRLTYADVAIARIFSILTIVILTGVAIVDFGGGPS